MLINLSIDNEFKDICEKIVDENKTDKEWELIESSDMFQTQHYCGGYDATESAFCFSYYNEGGDEFWFQIDLEDVKNLLRDGIAHVEARKPPI